MLLFLAQQAATSDENGKIFFQIKKFIFDLNELSLLSQSKWIDFIERIELECPYL